MDEHTKVLVAFYDETATKQDAAWGEHLHHGFYGPDEQAHVSTNQAAERRMVDELLKFAGVSEDPMKKPRNVIDVGCGFGGAVIFLAKKYGANCTGINLSPAQIQKAKDLAIVTSFVVGDALNQPFPDGQFDLVWSVEVIEHTPNKLKDIKMADFSENVLPFIRAIVQSQWTWQGLVSMLLNGWTYFKASQIWPLLLKAYENNVTMYTVIACRKPK